MELLIICWLLMGIAAGMIAAQKGRSGASFGCAGALFGPFGILAAMMASPAKRTTPSDDEGRVPCDTCREMILPDAKKCRFCGQEYEFTESAGDGEPADTEWRQAPRENQRRMSYLKEGRERRPRG